VEARVDKPILIGTWATAAWAIDFYRRNGFTLLSSSNKDSLLRRYWSIAETGRNVGRACMSDG
jgi:hypothetical protein